MKKILLSILLLIFSCESPAEPEDCFGVTGDNSSCVDECGVPNGDGSDCANCSEGGQWFETIPDNVTVRGGETTFCNEDLNALEQLRIANGLAVDHPLLVGNQTWRYGKLLILVASYNPSGSSGVDTQLTEIPPEFGDLTELTSLYMQMNQLTYLPDEFANLTNLSSLTISNNYLTGLPENFGNLNDMFFLDLGYNQLESIPESICELQSLYYFYLFNNNLADLPDCMCDLPVNWSGFDGVGNPFFGSGANELCYDIPDCIEESDNFEHILAQFYYSIVLNAPQDCP